MFILWFNLLTRVFLERCKQSMYIFHFHHYGLMNHMNGFFFFFFFDACQRSKTIIVIRITSSYFLEIFMKGWIEHRSIASGIISAECVYAQDRRTTGHAWYQSRPSPSTNRRIHWAIVHVGGVSFHRIEIWIVNNTFVWKNRIERLHCL
jgi:hypothetical protein